MKVGSDGAVKENNSGDMEKEECENEVKSHEREHMKTYFEKDDWVEVTCKRRNQDEQVHEGQEAGVRGEGGQVTEAHLRSDGGQQVGAHRPWRDHRGQCCGGVGLPEEMGRRV